MFMISPEDIMVRGRIHGESDPEVVAERLMGKIPRSCFNCVGRQYPWLDHGSDVMYCHTNNAMLGNQDWSACPHFSQNSRSLT